MLTRFAMVFFIMALAVIMLMFSHNEQKGLCQTQADLTAVQIASSITQVLTSPAEDERKVIPLIAALSVGENDQARYTVSIIKRESSKEIIVGVTTESKDCRSYQSVGYGNAEVQFQNSKWIPPGLSDPHQTTEAFGTQNFPALALTPSDVRDRSSYLVVIRCQEKKFNPTKYLYFQNCNFGGGATSVNPNSCLRLDSGDPGVPDVHSTCGFN